MTGRPGLRAGPVLVVAALGVAFVGNGVAGSGLSDMEEPVTAAPSAADTLVRVWGATVTATAGGRVGMAIRVDMSETGEPLGRIRGRARFTPTLLNFEGFTPGDASGELSVDTAAAERGVLGFELDAAGAAGSSGTATLVEITFWVTAAPGGLAPVVVEIDALEAGGSGADLLGRTEVREGTVIVR